MYVDPQGCLDGGENTHNEQTVWRDVRSMTQGERDSTEKLLLSVDECGMTLIFSNESTQLRERKVSVCACVFLFVANFTSANV